MVARDDLALIRMKLDGVDGRLVLRFVTSLETWGANTVPSSDAVYIQLTFFSKPSPVTLPECFLLNIPD